MEELIRIRSPILSEFNKNVRDRLLEVGWDGMEDVRFMFEMRWRCKERGRRVVVFVL